MYIKHSVSTSQRTRSICIIKTNQYGSGKKLLLIVITIRNLYAHYVTKFSARRITRRRVQLLRAFSLRHCRYHWSRGLRPRSAVARLLGLRVRIPLVEWMSVCCECCVLSGRGLCDGLITRPEESY